jgi:hypothetical protein
MRLPTLFAAFALLSACGRVPLASDVYPKLGVDRFAPVPADSVRVLELDNSPDWQPRLTDSIGAPYEVLASVQTLGAGGDAAADRARAAFRRRVGELGGNVAAILWVRKDAVPPYTRAYGDAIRVLPSMPDAPLRCRRLAATDSAGARVVACREAARLARTHPAPLRDLAIAHVALALRGAERRENGLGIQGAWSGAALAARQAARLDSAFGRPGPYLAGAVALTGDSVRAYQAIATVLVGGMGVVSPSEGAVAAYREVIRLAPDSVAPYANAVTILLAQRRPEEALRVAAALARRRPDRVEGWARAAVAANVMGDHARSMRYWACVLAIDPSYFRLSFVDPYGRTEYRGSEQRVGKQPPATVSDLP